MTPSVLADDITIVTESLPPFQIVDKNQKLTGFSTEIIQAMLKQAKVEADIQVLPWAQAYELALVQKNVLIFSLVRSKARQHKFKWVGDILKQHYYFFSLNERHDIHISNISDIKKYVTGVVKDSFEHQLLLSYGFSSPFNLRLDSSQAKLPELLKSQQVDLYFGSKISGLSLDKTLLKTNASLKQHYKINESPGNISIAFSKQTDDEVVTQFRKAFLEVHMNGTYTEIMKKWLNEF